jgi:hypothetical protein
LILPSILTMIFSSFCSPVIGSVIVKVLVW